MTKSDCSIMNMQEDNDVSAGEIILKNHISSEMMYWGVVCVMFNKMI